MEESRESLERTGEAFREPVVLRVPKTDPKSVTRGTSRQEKSRRSWDKWTKSGSPYWRRWTQRRQSWAQGTWRQCGSDSSPRVGCHFVNAISNAAHGPE